MSLVKTLDELGSRPSLLRGYKHMQSEMSYVNPLDELGARPNLIRGVACSSGKPRRLLLPVTRVAPTCHACLVLQVTRGCSYKSCMLALTSHARLPWPCCHKGSVTRRVRLCEELSCMFLIYRIRIPPQSRHTESSTSASAWHSRSEVRAPVGRPAALGVDVLPHT